jgi:cellulose synthase/poly-beta-1,6-N-acetylglucosamine synthase-like glycosyltransferase
MNTSITYAITVCNELTEIKNIIDRLKKLATGDYEILIQFDEENGSDDVKKYLETVDDIRVVSYPLNNNFAAFKNNLKRNSNKNWIFQLDADEIPSDDLINNIYALLDDMEKSGVGILSLPRINTVDGISDDHIKSWGWRITVQEHPALLITRFLSAMQVNYLKLLQKHNCIVDSDKDFIQFYAPLINFPDYQSRIYRKVHEIIWEGKVHERLIGWPLISRVEGDTFDEQYSYAILHHKEIQKQEIQNKFYDNI